MRNTEFNAHVWARDFPIFLTTCPRAIKQAGPVFKLLQNLPLFIQYAMLIAIVGCWALRIGDWGGDWWGFS
jgi:hypothetical protein